MIIAITNQKGGTGKTTTAAAICQAAASRGVKVLAIDLDTQGNLTYFLKGSANMPGAFELLAGKLPATKTIQTTPQDIDLMAASLNLSSLTTGKGTARRLEKAIAPLKKKYPLIVIDTPSIIGELQFNAIQAADKVIIPTQAAAGGLQGLHQLADTITAFKQSNQNLQIYVVFTALDTRSNIVKTMAGVIEQTATSKGYSLLKAIRPAAVVQEAQALQVNLFSYAPNAKPTADYMELFDTITEGKFKNE